MRTFGQLRAEILQWLDESTATTTSSSYMNVEYALKQAHTVRLTEDNWRFMLWPRVETFTTTSSSAYSLHQEFLRPYYFRNTSRNVWLIETPTRQIEPIGIDLFQDTGSDRFSIQGRSQVQNQPSSASVITIVSSSAADNTVAKAITIYGDTASGVTSESITPNGTTPAAGTTQFTNIISVTKGADWAGTLTMTSNSGAVTNLTLFAAEMGRQYLQFQFLGAPSSGETVSYRFYRKPRELSASNDLTDIPSPFERVLVFDALLLMGAYDNRLDNGRMGLWTRMRDDLDFQMRQAHMEGQSIGADAQFISDRYDGIRMRMSD